MRFLLTITFVTCVTTVLLLGNKFVAKFSYILHADTFINALLKYQIFAFFFAFFLLSFSLIIFPGSKQWLTIGNLRVVATKENWLGINGKSTWLTNGVQLLIFISLATFVFMFLGVWHSNSFSNFKWWFLPIAILFSLTNAFAEEIIFRFFVIAKLVNYYPNWLVLFTSAILFGLPHYFGNPGGIIGVIMSAVLGYILCKATIETKGLGIAYVIHVIQDIIIFLALMMMNVNA